MSGPCSPCGCYFRLWAGPGRHSSFGCPWAWPSDWKFCEPAQGWLYLVSGTEVTEIESTALDHRVWAPTKGRESHLPSWASWWDSPPDLFGRVGEVCRGTLHTVAGGAHPSPTGLLSLADPARRAGMGSANSTHKVGFESGCLFCFT